MKSISGQALLLVAFTFMLTFEVDAARFEGSISTDFETDLAYVGRFVYHPKEEAIFHYDIKVPANECCASLAIFRGVEEQWPQMRAKQDEMTCIEKKDLIPGTQNSYMHLLPGVGRPCYNVTDDDGSQIIHCVGKKSFTTFRDWWYYITFMNCHYLRTVGVNVQYKLHLLNGDRYWNREFSADESSMLETTLICGIILALFIVVASIFRVQLSNQRQLHTTYKIWYLSLISQFIGVVILAIALFNFAVDGFERSNTTLTGHIFTSIGNVIFTAVLILMGKGYTITRLDIRRLGVVKIVVFVLTYSTTFLTLYILQEKADKRDLKNIYGSEAAIGLVMLRFAGLGWILYGIFFTMKNYPKKRAFYLAFTVFAIGWFLSEPIIIILSNYNLPLYCRAKVVHGVYLFVAVLGHAAFLFLTRPSTTNKFFPFHLSTNKVGFELPDEDSFMKNSRYLWDPSYKRYLVQRDPDLDLNHTVKTPSSVQSISGDSVSMEYVNFSAITDEILKPVPLTPQQKLFRALEEVDRSIEEDRAAERKLEAILGFQVGGQKKRPEELCISPCKEVVDGTFSGRDPNKNIKSVAGKEIKTNSALPKDASPSKKECTPKEEAARVKAKQLEDIFVTSHQKEIKATPGGSTTPPMTTVDTPPTYIKEIKTTPGGSNTPPKTTVDTPPSSCKIENKLLQNSSKSVTVTPSSSPFLTSERGEKVSAAKQILPSEPILPSPASGQGDINSQQVHTKTSANVINDPKLIVTKKNKVPKVKLNARYETRTEEQLRELFVTSKNTKPTHCDAAQIVNEGLCPPQENIKKNALQTAISFDEDSSDEPENHSLTVKNSQIRAQYYRRLGLRPPQENIKKNALQTAISFDEDSSDEPEFESTEIQPATIKSGLSDPFGCGQVGLEIPGKRWVQENILWGGPSTSSFYKCKILPPANTQKPTVKESENELPSAKNASSVTSNQRPVREKESFARMQFRLYHRLDDPPKTKPKVQHSDHSSTTLYKVENEVQQLPSQNTNHHQRLTSTVKIVNKMEQLPPAKKSTQHHVPSNTVLKVEKEMQQLSPAKTQHRQHSNGVAKPVNKMEQLSPAKTQHRQHSNGVVKTVNKMEQLSPAQRYYTKHQGQPATILRVENEMEQLSSCKTKHHQQPAGTVKTLNRMEQLPPEKVKSSSVSTNTSEYSPSSRHRYITCAQIFAAEQHATSTMHNVYKVQTSRPSVLTAKRELIREVDEMPQSREECLESLRQLRDELAMAERQDQKMSPSITSSESSLGSVLDVERGDGKKKKRRSPVHKVKKMLGMKKHREGQMQNIG